MKGVDSYQRGAAPASDAPGSLPSVLRWGQQVTHRSLDSRRACLSLRCRAEIEPVTGRSRGFRGLAEGQRLCENKDSVHRCRVATRQQRHCDRSTVLLQRPPGASGAAAITLWPARPIQPIVPPSSPRSRSRGRRGRGGPAGRHCSASLATASPETVPCGRPCLCYCACRLSHRRTTRSEPWVGCWPGLKDSLRQRLGCSCPRCSATATLGSQCL